MQGGDPYAIPDFGDAQGTGMGVWPHALQQCVLPLYLVDEVGPHPLGTCFSVGEGILLTAAHVVDTLPPLASDGVVQGPPFLVTGVVAIDDTHPDGGTVTVFLIERITSAERGDTAVLTLAQTQGFPLPTHVPLTFRIPKPGDEVVVLGYGHLDAPRLADGRPVIRAPLFATRGTVANFHPNGRDPLLAPYPCIEGDFPVPSGMSGGPVLFAGESPEAGVCAIATRAIYPSEQPPIWSSVAALTPPVLALTVFGRVEDEGPRNWTLHEMATRGIVKTDDTLDRVRLVPEGDGYGVDWFDPGG